MIISIIIVVGCFYAIYTFGRGLPDYTQLADYEPPVMTRVQAGDGRLLVEYATQQRVFVPISAMPKMLVNAFLSAEDKNFYYHPGIDPVGIMRAVLINVKNFAQGFPSNIKSGITKGLDFGKTVGSGILSAITGIPFAGQILSGITSQFENRPLGAGVIDEFGNVYDPEALNKMNALGGYYTDPARSARRRTARIAKMIERQKLGKKISLKNLAKLQAQEKAQREMQEKATKAMAAQNKAEGKGGYQSDFAQDSGFMGGSGTAAEMGSFKNGGLVSLL